MVTGKNSSLFENVDVVFKVLDSSFLYSDVFLGKLEHVLQFLQGEFFVYLGLVFDLFGALAKSEGRPRLFFVEDRW